MKIREALTFDDVLLVPDKSNFIPDEARTVTNITPSISLNIPLLSSAMDTVTETRMAIVMSQAGGLGVIHRNMTIKEQALAVEKVKRFESGMVFDPKTLYPYSKVAEAKKLAQKYNITGFPVIDDKRRVLGIVTNRDIRFVLDENTPVKDIMTKDNLAIISEPVDTIKARKLMADRRIEKLLVVNDKFELCGLLTIKDLEQAVLNPVASKDKLGRLRSAAASTIGDKGFERSVALIDAEVDLIVIDTAHGHSEAVSEAVNRIKKFNSTVQVMAGNVVTAEATKVLINSGADSVKVGMGPGSICTTRVIAGVGIPQMTAVFDCAQAAANGACSIIADGGIKFSGDIAKAIAAGADAVMVGSLLAGTNEAPGEIVLYEGRNFKAYRGMGSLGAMALGSADRYFQKEFLGAELVPEGVEGQVPFKGPASNILHQLVGGLRAAMGYTGNKTIEEMQINCEFVKISNAGLSESHVHDVQITRESPNYRIL